MCKCGGLQSACSRHRANAVLSLPSGEFGLWLDGDLYHGRSHSCKTFGNPMLSKKEDFFVQDIEIWTFE